MTLESLTRSFTSQGGLWAYVTVFLATFVEGFFPPLPSDVAVLFCALMVARGGLHWLPCLLAAFVGGSMGALVVYWFGATHGRGYFLAKPRLFMSPQRLLSLEGSFRRYGDIILFLNRAVVGGRSFGFLLAGLTHYQLRRVLLYGLPGIFLWYLMLMILGIRFGAMAKQLVNGIVVVVMALLALSVLSLLVSRRLMK
jgi:membrane protein DedA with SNARE-associated domain